MTKSYDSRTDPGTSFDNEPAPDSITGVVNTERFPQPGPPVIERIPVSEPMPSSAGTQVMPRGGVTAPIAFSPSVPPAAERTRVMDAPWAARPSYPSSPYSVPQSSPALQPPPAVLRSPSNPNFPPAPPQSDRVLLPEASKRGPVVVGDSAPLPGWVLPYVIGSIALALVGAFILWTQAHVLGHY